MASWRDPSGTRSLELDETHKHATVVEPLPQPVRAARSAGGAWTARRSQLTWFPAVARA